MTENRQSLKRPRITGEQVQEMMRMRRQGESIKVIAQAIGCHRQTVRTYLREKHGDILAEEARKEVLTGELLGHFRELVNFAQVGLKHRLDASPLKQVRKIAAARQPESISLDGLLGLPSIGPPTFMHNEWARIYHPSAKDDYLMKSLREHTKESTVWTYWDEWRRKLAEYETRSRDYYEWLKDNVEIDLYDIIDVNQARLVQMWLFGSILRITSGGGAEWLQIKGQTLLSTETKATTTTGEEYSLILAQTKDESGRKYLQEYMFDILNKAHDNPQYSELQHFTAQTMLKESQIELRHIARNMDTALASIELMRAFPGRCSLCPV
ncbi:hypothetical protein ACFLTK_04935 [Chloroflexota bacterium]